MVTLNRRGGLTLCPGLPLQEPLHHLIANSVTGFASFLALNILLRRKHGDLSPLKPVTIGFVKTIPRGGLMAPRPGACTN